MSQENVAIVQQWVAAFNAHDLAAWMKLLGPEFEFVDHMGAVGEEGGSSLDAIRRQLEGWWEAFPDLRADAHEFIDAGDRVVCVTHWHGTGAASGLPYDQLAAEVHIVHAGRIVRSELGYVNKAEALEAAGLEE